MVPLTHDIIFGSGDAICIKTHVEIYFYSSTFGHGHQSSLARKPLNPGTTNNFPFDIDFPVDFQEKPCSIIPFDGLFPITSFTEKQQLYSAL